jgi:hypothetical protein
MAKDHGPSIKNDEQYEKLVEEGMSKSKAARIANDSNSGEKGGKADNYEERTKEELYKKAQEIGIEGRSDMSRDELIKTLRNH